MLMFRQGYLMTKQYHICLMAKYLLLFGNKNSKQIPAKIYDYFGADGIIFVILGDDKDPILDVVKDKEKCIVVNNKAEEIVAGIYKLFDH